MEGFKGGDRSNLYSSVCFCSSDSNKRVRKVINDTFRLLLKSNELIINISIITTITNVQLCYQNRRWKKNMKLKQLKNFKQLFVKSSIFLIDSGVSEQQLEVKGQHVACFSFKTGLNGGMRWSRRRRAVSHYTSLCRVYLHCSYLVIVIRLLLYLLSLKKLLPQFLFFCRHLCHSQFLDDVCVTQLITDCLIVHARSLWAETSTVFSKGPVLIFSVSRDSD